MLLLGGQMSAQQIPMLGNSSDLVWDKHQELDIGKAAYERLLRQGNIHQNQSDQDYLDYLGNKLATYTSTRLGLNFYITRSRSINAFASPGGYIGVNAGLILATDNEHELAGVLAHEISHISQEHIARMLLAAKDRQVMNTAAMVAGVLMATKTSGQAGSSVLTAVIANETQQQLNDIREHEKEADRIGRQTMEKAGFNELGMQTFFQKLYMPKKAMGTPSYLLTHPLPINRQADIDSLKKRSKSLRSSDEYYLFRARIRAALLGQTAISRIISEERDSTVVAIRDASYYLLALTLMKQGKLSAAIDTVARMQSKMRDNRDVKLLRAKLHLLRSQNAQAQALYQQLWKSYRGDSVVAYDYARFLSDKGRYRQAAKLLKGQLNSQRLNPQLYWLYGEILGKLGERTQQNQMLIRYYEQIGDYDKALAQAQVAANLAGGDWRSRSMFEAKQADLQRLIERLKE